MTSTSSLITLIALLLEVDNYVYSFTPSALNRVRGVQSSHSHHGVTGNYIFDVK